MNALRLSSLISADAEVAAASRSRLLRLPMRSLFSCRFKNRSCSRPSGVRLHCCGRRLTNSEEDETIIINRSAGSTYPKRKSVRRSGATPDLHPRDHRQAQRDPRAHASGRA